MVWLGGGFGSQKPRPSHKARAFVELFSISKRWGLDSNAISTTITCIYYIINFHKTANSVNEIWQLSLINLFIDTGNIDLASQNPH